MNESFRKAERAFESDMGVKEGFDDFVCPYCGLEYSLKYHEESGGGEYIGDPWCPVCGWPAFNEDEYDDFASCSKVYNKDIKAPCPICGKISNAILHVECQCVQLSCGHWVGEEFFEYAEAYKEMIKKMGLKHTLMHESFIRRHPEAGVDEPRKAGWWMRKKMSELKSGEENHE